MPAAVFSRLFYRAFYRPARHACHAGFTLIEVMVALCIVAIGLGGAASLHLRSQRAAAHAAHLADGVRLAAALAERMRANPVAMAWDDGANPYLRFDVEAGAGVPAPVSHCYADAACTPEALARFDLLETALALAAGFPHGRVLACRDGAASDPASWSCDGAVGAPIVIKLGWSDSGSPPAPVVLLPVGAPSP